MAYFKDLSELFKGKIKKNFRPYVDQKKVIFCQFLSNFIEYKFMQTLWLFCLVALRTNQTSKSNPLIIISLISKSDFIKNPSDLIRYFCKVGWLEDIEADIIRDLEAVAEGTSWYNETVLGIRRCFKNEYFLKNHLFGTSRVLYFECFGTIWNEGEKPKRTILRCTDMLSKKHP